MVQSERQYQKLKPEESPKTRDVLTSSLQDDFKLTNREREVLEHLARGLSNSEIGQKLHLSSRTIEKYVSSLLRKTTTNNRAELVRFSLEHRLID
jgi:DNA-binding NarL/FixJ family response regulator